RAIRSDVTYFHILLDHHSLIKANGMWTESLYLGSECMKMLSPGSRSEIFDLFPHLIGNLGGFGQKVRYQPKSNQVSLLI
ncbi:MAG: Hint domain-containing protein, partial [Pseudomonadota bacterium]